MRTSSGHLYGLSAAVFLVALALAGSAVAGTGKPLISGITASKSGAGAGRTLTITGKNFVGVTAVKIGSHTLNFTVTSSTEITARVPANLVKALPRGGLVEVIKRIHALYYTEKSPFGPNCGWNC